MTWLEVVLAGEPLLVATEDTDGSRLEGGLDVEAEGLLCLGDLLGSSTFFSTHLSGEEDLLDCLAFLVDFCFGGDCEGSRLEETCWLCVSFVS